MKSKWSDHEAAEVVSRYHDQGYKQDIAICTYTTRLLGGDPELDTYLLALAKVHGGQLASFDRKLSAAAVKGGKSALHLIPAR